MRFANNIANSILALILLTGNSIAESPQKLRVHFLAAGYGDAILIELPDRTNIVLDAGEKAYGAKMAGYLASHRIEKIDTAVITHPHKNHFEGFFEIVKKFPIGRVFINGDPNTEEGHTDLLRIFKELGVPVRTLRAGSSIGKLPAGVKIYVLNPRRISESVNDNSLVLWLRYHETSFLFTADIEEKRQDEILKKFPQVTEAGCVQIPHHGGPVSNAFAGAFPASLFVISTGKNPWGILFTEDLEKFKNRVFRTDQGRAVVFESDGYHLKVLHPQP